MAKIAGFLTLNNQPVGIRFEGLNGRSKHKTYYDTTLEAIGLTPEYKSLDFSKIPRLPLIEVGDKLKTQDEIDSEFVKVWEVSKDSSDFLEIAADIKKNIPFEYCEQAVREMVYKVCTFKNYNAKIVKTEIYRKGAQYHFSEVGDGLSVYTLLYLEPPVKFIWNTDKEHCQEYYECDSIIAYEDFGDGTPIDHTFKEWRDYAEQVQKEMAKKYGVRTRCTLDGENGLIMLQCQAGNTCVYSEYQRARNHV